MGPFLPDSTAERCQTRALCYPRGQPRCCRGSSSCFCDEQSWTSARVELRGWRRQSCWSLSPPEHSWPPLQHQERGEGTKTRVGHVLMVNTNYVPLSGLQAEQKPCYITRVGLHPKPGFIQKLGPTSRWGFLTQPQSSQALCTQNGASA